ncbi:hypothetical protein Pelo_8453 [Pelomyxa schiedti]|nr:hypothetical protein Pelo_8453 [Pelomyxa schiedti]
MSDDGPTECPFSWGAPGEQARVPHNPDGSDADPTHHKTRRHRHHKAKRRGTHKHPASSPLGSATQQEDDQDGNNGNSDHEPDYDSGDDGDGDAEVDKQSNNSDGSDSDDDDDDWESATHPCAKSADGAQLGGSSSSNNSNSSSSSEYFNGLRFHHPPKAQGGDQGESASSGSPSSLMDAVAIAHHVTSPGQQWARPTAGHCPRAESVSDITIATADDDDDRGGTLVLDIEPKIVPAGSSKLDLIDVKGYLEANTHKGKGWLFNFRRTKVAPMSPPMSSDGDSPLLDLPDELILRIVSFLGLRGILRTSVTCKRLHCLIYDTAVWKNLAVKYHLPEDTSKALFALEKTKRKTRRFNIRYSIKSLHGAHKRSIARDRIRFASCRFWDFLYASLLIYSLVFSILRLDSYISWGWMSVLFPLYVVFMHSFIVILLFYRYLYKFGHEDAELHYESRGLAKCAVPLFADLICSVRTFLGAGCQYYSHYL